MIRYTYQVDNSINARTMLRAEELKKQLEEKQRKEQLKREHSKNVGRKNYEAYKKKVLSS